MTVTNARVVDYSRPAQAAVTVRAIAFAKPLSYQVVARFSSTAGVIQRLSEARHAAGRAAGPDRQLNFLIGAQRVAKPVLGLFAVPLPLPMQVFIAPNDNMLGMEFYSAAPIRWGS